MAAGVRTDQHGCKAKVLAGLLTASTHPGQTGGDDNGERKERFSRAWVPPIRG